MHATPEKPAFVPRHITLTLDSRLEVEWVDRIVSKLAPEDLVEVRLNEAEIEFIFHTFRLLRDAAAGKGCGFSLPAHGHKIKETS